VKRILSKDIIKLKIDKLSELENYISNFGVILTAIYILITFLNI